MKSLELQKFNLQAQKFDAINIILEYWMGSIFVFLSPNLLREMNWETSCMVYIGELSMVFIGVDRIL